jgi:hypothetical protein
MPIECMPSNVCSDVRCAVCGQGFLVFAERHAHTQLADLRKAVQQALRQHHTVSEHPVGPFTVDCSIGAPHTSLA